MKKIVLILMMLTCMVSLAACGGDTNSGESSSTIIQSSEVNSAVTEERDSSNDSSETNVADSKPDDTGNKSLVVYFSWSGNTENVAKSIQSQTDSDLFEIVPVTSYSEDYDTVLDLAQEEQRNDARPEIADALANIDEYNTIFLGFPIWWYVAPKIINTFVESYDFSGKTIIPFATSGGSGMGKTVEVLQSLCPNANWENGKVVNGMSEEAIKEWVNTF